VAPLPVGLSLGLHLLCEVKRRQILGLLDFWKQESRVHATSCGLLVVVCASLELL
jgi:hypothetical protein